MTRRRPAPPPGAAPGRPDDDEGADPLEAVAFPGQGVDPLDLAAALREHAGHPLVERLADLLGTTAWDDLDLTDTRVAQPAVYAAGLAQAEATGPDSATIGATFGHSLGELAAFAHAGAYPADVGLDLVVRRAELGHEAHRRRPGRMVVVMRLGEAQVEWVRRHVVGGGHGVLELAVVNGPGQFVLSGDADAAVAALDVIAELGGVGRIMPIGGGYHSPLLDAVVPSFAEAVAAAVRADPAVPVVSCTTQQVVRSAGDVATVLARALVLPVRWEATLAAVRALGVTGAVDAGPSQTLANLARFAPVLPFRSLRPDR